MTGRDGSDLGINVKCALIQADVPRSTRDPEEKTLIGQERLKRKITGNLVPYRPYDL